MFIRCLIVSDDFLAADDAQDQEQNDQGEADEEQDLGQAGGGAGYAREPKQCRHDGNDGENKRPFEYGVSP